MINIKNLKPLISDDKLKTEIDHEQIKIFNDNFVDDFITNPFEVKGKKIRIENKPPKATEFSAYTESFYHIITRTTNYYNERLYDCNRANRIHWIKPILLSPPSKEIMYYRWKDEKGICKEHFWHFSEKFMVVLKTISNDFQIVTAFCVDDDEKQKYFERFRDFKDKIKIC